MFGNLSYVAVLCSKTQEKDFFSGLQVYQRAAAEVVGPAGLEPARPYGQQILSLQRLPFRHGPLKCNFSK